MYNFILPQFLNFFNFDEPTTVLVLSLVGAANFVLAIPAALFHRQIGYKFGILFALSVLAFSSFLLYLAIVQHGYGYFLAAIIGLGAGWALLETSINPLAVEAGDGKTAVWRLNVAQTFYAVGLLVGYYLAGWLINFHYNLSVGAMAQWLSRPYCLIGLGVILLAYFIEQIRLPAFATARADPSSSLREEFRSLLTDKRFLFAAAALCAYCLVINIVWVSDLRYRRFALTDPGFGTFGSTLFLFAVGRLVGCGLMRRIAPRRLLQWCAGLSLMAIVVSSAVGGMTGYVSLASVTLFAAIIYPTVFGDAIRRMGDRTKLASGLLVTAVGLGSALGPVIVGPALTVWNVRIVLLLAVLPLAVILAYALMRRE
jgi:FHS family L-fucose permease-like MFS transporter